MTLQQLEYITALDTYGQFSEAATHCFVSQPSLSAMVKKLEEELGITIFDRRKQPIVVTEIGQEIVKQARIVLQEAETLRQIVTNLDEIPRGTLRIGVIPTIAPYLLPLFIDNFSRSFPEIRLEITENTTENLEKSLMQGLLDACILATHIQSPNFEAIPLYKEEFVVYAPNEESIVSKEYLLAEDIDPEKVVLMEEGHCIREQVVNLCSLHNTQSRLSNIYFEAGNLETLRRLVEAHPGITILPQMAIFDLDEDRMQYVRFFHPPAPVREVTLVTSSKCPRRKLTNRLAETIKESVK